MAAGSKSARSTPLLGLAFLISAITAGKPAAILARNAAMKSRAAAGLFGVAAYRGQRPPLPGFGNLPRV